MRNFVLGMILFTSAHAQPGWQGEELAKVEIPLPKGYKEPDEATRQKTIKESGFVDISDSKEKGSPRKFTMSDDNREKKAKAIGAVAGIYKHVQCTVCEQVVLNISQTLLKAEYDGEIDLSEKLDQFCELSSKESWPNHFMENEKWVLEKAGKKKRWLMREPTSAEKAKGKPTAMASDPDAYWDHVRDVNVARKACEVSVKEPQTEIAEWLFPKMKKGKTPSVHDLQEKICVEIAEACKPKKKKGEL